ncbi:MAG TPA: oligosaccharide flippase family protein [Flavisolibacter sp.]|nr:oligosaccharide flippase family protein [Flavisolibacter sp.]
MSTKAVGAKLKRNALFSSSSFVFISAVNFITLPFIIGKMNVEVFGIYTLLTGLFGYFGIFDFGLGQGLVKFVSEYQARNEHRNISLAINSCLIFQTGLVLVLAAILFLSAGSIIALVNVSPGYLTQSIAALRISLLGLIFSFISATFSSVLMGMQRYDLTSSVDSISNLVLNVSLVALLMIYDLSLSQAVGISVVFSFVSLAAYAFLLRRHVFHYRPRLEFDLSIVKKFIKYSINIFLSKLSALFSNHLVRFILAYFLTPAAVTLFVVPSKLLASVGGMLSSGANAIFPFISSLHANKDTGGIRKSFLTASMLFAGISIPVLLFVALYAHPILSIWMGPSFAGQTWALLCIISISGLIGSASTIPNLVIMGMGNSRLIAFFSLVAIILYLIFLPLLTSRFGLIGCGVALLINTVVTIGMVFHYNLRFIDIPMGEFLRATYMPHVLPVVLFVGLSLILGLVLPQSAWLLMGCGMMLTAAYYLFIYRTMYHKWMKKDSTGVGSLAPAEAVA